MNENIEQLLTEIRDLHIEHLTEYRRIAEQSLRVQAMAVKRQGRAIQIGLALLALFAIFIAVMVLAAHLNR